MDWMEWVIIGVVIAFFVTLGIVAGTAIRNANKS